MAPEMEVSSTVASGNSNHSSDSDQSNEMPMTTVSAVSLNASAVNLHPNIENQYKVSEFDRFICAIVQFVHWLLMFSSVICVMQHTLVCVPTMVTIPNTITQQSQGHQSDSPFQLALAATGPANSFTAIRDGLKTTTTTTTLSAKPATMQHQQLQQNLSKMQGIVFANAIQLQQSQLPATTAVKLQRQSTAPQQQPNTSKTTQPLAARTIQRAHKIQIPQAPPPQIVVRRQSGEK